MNVDGCRGAGSRRVAGGRIGAIGLAVAIVLGQSICGALAPERASASLYRVVQCGWRVGNQASWHDTSAGKFSHDAYCVPPAGRDATDGTHVKSKTAAGAPTVSAAKYAGWRWDAPAGTSIVAFQGDRWHRLHDGFRHRIGWISAAGSFTPFLDFTSTDDVPRHFIGTFSPGVKAVESRLLCARPPGGYCRMDRTSSAAVRAVRLTLDDPSRPSVAVSGPATASGWKRGRVRLDYGAFDSGSGISVFRTLVGLTVVATGRPACSVATISGHPTGTRLAPCPGGSSGSAAVDTTAFGDGPHQLSECADDFAGNRACVSAGTLHIDNHAPGTPRSMRLAGGERWRNRNGFDLGWSLPAQGRGAPIAGSLYRVVADSGYDSGIRWGGLSSNPGIEVPGPGEYRVSVWLFDLAGNQSASTAATATLRFDDEPPVANFRSPDPSRPGVAIVDVSDRHSGIERGEVAYRPKGGSGWRPIPSGLKKDARGRRMLVALFPAAELPLGHRYELRAQVYDVAGNRTVATGWANGTKPPPEPPESPAEDDPPGKPKPQAKKPKASPKPPARARAETRIDAVLESGDRRRRELTVGFGGRARLSGRLTGRGGSGLAGRPVSVRIEPVRGASGGRRSLVAVTGPGGRFSLALGPGPSRRVEARFAGNGRFEPAGSGPLRLSVRGGIVLRARPHRLRTGRRVRLRGRIKAPGAIGLGRDRLVAIQYLERRSHRWRPVAFTRTRRHGRFHTSYRFRYITRRTRIRMRAVLLVGNGFPYLGSHSRPVRVVVRKRSGRDRRHHGRDRHTRHGHDHGRHGHDRHGRHRNRRGRDDRRRRRR